MPVGLVYTKESGCELKLIPGIRADQGLQGFHYVPRTWSYLMFVSVESLGLEEVRRLMGLVEVRRRIGLEEVRQWVGLEEVRRRIGV